jgi:uncharacterized protein
MLSSPLLSLQTLPAAVLQEILHRYVAIDRRDAIQPAFDALLGVVDQCWRLTKPWCSVRSRLFWGIDSRAARGAMNLSVMEQNGIDQILSFDSGFNAFARITRFS